MHRTIQIAASFAITVAAYLCYWLIAVPLIEPSGPREGYSGGEATGELQTTRRAAELAEIFPPGSWELEDAKVLQSDQFKLLFREYANQGDGVVKITPCTMVFTPDDPGESGDRTKLAAPIILQAPQGALLKFDEALNLKRAKIGKLVGGRFIDRITVFSHGEKPGKEDDLLFITDDLQLSETEVHTTRGVQFSYGPHYGSGREMRIKLAQSKGEGDSDQSRGPKVGGIESLVIKHLEQFHLEVPADRQADSLQAGGKGSPAAEQKKIDDKNAAAKTIAVEVACQGPFCINLVENVITFQDRVDVMRLYPDGPADQINCELLSVYIAPKNDAAANGPGEEKPAEKKTEKPGLDAMEPRRIEALGNPVVVRAPRHEMEARGVQLQYDMAGGQIRLDGRPPAAAANAAAQEEVFLRQGGNEIHAVDLQYQPAESQRQIGKLVAQGPGRFRGQMSDKPARTAAPAAADAAQTGQAPAESGKKPRIIEASWKGLLRLRPDNQYQAVSPRDKFHAISLSDEATLNFPGFGRLSADEIHFWMIESKPAPKVADEDEPIKKGNDSGLKPHSMLAQGNQAVPAEANKVKIESPQLNATVAKLQVWFEEGENPVGQTNRGARQYAAFGAAGVRAEQTAHAAQPAPGNAGGYPQTSAAPPVYVPGAAAGLPGSAGNAIPAKPNNHFEVVGELLRASVTLSEPAELSSLTISGEVQLTETQTAKPDDDPVVVLGDKIVVRNASRPHAEVIVSGRPAVPARFQGQGLGLVGAEINLNRGINRLWMDCPGTMTLPPLNRDLQGRPTSGGGPMSVEWQDGMEFDGRTATFEQSVVATSKDQMLRTETLKVSLDRTVDFDKTSRLDEGAEQQPQVQEVRCSGGVTLESRSYDEQQGLLSRELLTAANLTLNNASGEISAAGPGTVKIVRRGSPDLGAFGAAPGLPQTAPVSPAFAGPQAGSAPASGPQNGGNGQNAAADNGISYLNINFLESITGNIFRRKIDFNDEVKAVYGPVDSWESRLPDDDPDAVGPDGAILSCHRLSLTSMPMPFTKQQSVELEAVGNALIEGALFTARAARVSFNQAKDVLILEGDGRNPATLFHQEIIGGPEQSLIAKRIMYRPRTRQTDVEGAQSVELHIDPKAQK